MSWSCAARAGLEILAEGVRLQHLQLKSKWYKFLHVYEALCSKWVAYPIARRVAVASSYFDAEVSVGAIGNFLPWGRRVQNIFGSAHFVAN